MASSRIGWRLSGLPVESIRGATEIAAATRLLRLGFSSALEDRGRGMQEKGGEEKTVKEIKTGMKLRTQKLLPQG